MENRYIDAAKALKHDYIHVQHMRTAFKSINDAIALLEEAGHELQKRSLLTEIAANAKPILPFIEIVGLIKVRELLNMPPYQTGEPSIDLTAHTNAYIARIAMSGAIITSTTYNPNTHSVIITYQAERPMPFLAPEPTEDERHAEQWTTVALHCIFCHKAQRIHVKRTDLKRWQNPADYSSIPAKDIFPYLSATELELLISGTCDDCFPKEPIEHETEYAERDEHPDIDPDDLPQEDDAPNALQNELIQLGNEDLARELS